VGDACQNGVKDHNETDVDCGGDKCDKCKLNQSCQQNSDCIDGYCVDQKCSDLPQCENGVQNLQESDVDCGGNCPPCEDGKKCRDNADCISQVCNAQGICAAPTCDDKQQNGDETDVDCGGSKCDACKYGQKCKVNADCLSQLCTNGRCACRYISHCTHGHNCIQNQCIAANHPGCAEYKNAYPPINDGEYWLTSASGVIRVYCDMQMQKVLCSTVESTQTGRTRDASALAYTMTSVLMEDGTCKIWNLRGTSDGKPLDRLHKHQGNTLDTCQALGFLADHQINSCPYGASYTNCGYPGTLYRYGNWCSGCTSYDGQYNRYVLQGAMNTASIISNTSGTIASFCKTIPQ
jgi:hypothetical protein